MLLAGNGPSPTHCKAPTIAQVPAPIPRPSPSDGVFRNQAHITSTISGLPSPLSMTSHASSHSGGAFSSTNELAIVKTVGTSASPIDHSEASKVVVSSVGSAMTNLIPAGIALRIFFHVCYCYCYMGDVYAPFVLFSH